LTAWTHNFGEEFETRAVMHAALVLAPLVAVATASGQPIWLEAGIVSGSAFIVMEKTNLAPLGVALHGVAIALGFLVLLAAISTPPAFVGATAAMAGASILVTAKGDKLRSLGNFTLYPRALSGLRSGRGDSARRSIRAWVVLPPLYSCCFAPGDCPGRGRTRARR
jgi:hypothetical protein